MARLAPGLEARLQLLLRPTNVALEQRDHPQAEPAQHSQMLILQLRGNRQPVLEERPRPREVLLLEGDLAQLLQTQSLPLPVAEPPADLEAQLTPGGGCGVVALGPSHETGASHRLSPDPARLAAAREGRRQPRTALGVTTLRVPETPESGRQAKLSFEVDTPLASRVLEH